MTSAGFGAAYRHLRDLFGSGSVVGLGDGQLLSRYSSSKDEAAFEGLVSRHGPMVLATCRAVLRNEHDVEDAFQATFLVLARKAGSVRGGDALGGWLHRVAYRASVEASIEAKRRRRKEAEASAMAQATESRADLELAATLHEEINRLPETRRLPVVLCDLEGLTYEQAACQLRWTVPTLRHRLADGRQRLRDRLTRRGLMVPAIGAILASNARAAVPIALARLTVSAATGGSASAASSLLAHTLLRGMLMTKLKIAGSAMLAALALATGGFFAVGAGRSDEPKPAMKPQANKIVSQEKPVDAKSLDMVAVRGRVVAPDGQPVSGATVRVEHYSSGSVLNFPSVTSGSDGRFSIRLPRPAEADLRGFMAQFPRLLATAQGFGVGWTDRVLRADRPDELVVALVEEGPIIGGRVVDLEGRPVAGANLEVARIHFEAKNDFAGWIAKARKGAAGTNLWPGLESLNVGLSRLIPISTMTDSEGHFRLTGIGRDRVAELIVTGPGVATTEVQAMTRDEPEVQLTSRAEFTLPTILVHGPRLQIALAPSKPVEGIVRDLESSQSIVGLTIQAGVFEDRSVSRTPGVEATTDAQGHYRLDGLPKASAYRLFFSPAPGLLYSRGTMKAPAGSPGLEPVAFDFSLRKGLVTRGTVTDKATGRPIRGTVFYLPFSDNPHVDKFPGLAPLFDMEYARIAEDGRYEITAIPGHGLLAVMDSEGRHRTAVGLESIKGYDASMQGFTTMPPIPASGYNAFAETNFDPNAKSATVDLQVDSGRQAKVQVVDPEGRPIGGTKVRGIGARGWPILEDQKLASFEILSLDPAQPRRVVVTHEARKLVGSALLRGDEAGPVIIRLQPWGIVTGRVVDDEGRPRKKLALANSNDQRQPGKSEERADLPVGLVGGSGDPIGDDGRFRVEGLVPGLKYGGYAVEAAMVLGDLFREVIVAPGEVKDLGDLKVQPNRPGGN